MIRCKCFHVELKKAHQLLERLFDSPVPSWFDLLKQKLFRLSKLKLPSAGIPSDGNGISIDAGEISFGELKDDNALRAALTQSVDALTRYLEDALKASADKHRIFLLFDRIDENWLPSNLNECQLMIKNSYKPANISHRISTEQFDRSSSCVRTFSILSTRLTIATSSDRIVAAR